MSTTLPQLDPATGEPLPEKKNDPFAPVEWAKNYRYDGEQPLVSARRPELDPSTGEPIDSPPMTPDDAKDAFTAAVHAKMTGTTPGDAYLNRDAFDSELRERGGDDYDKGVGYAIETGFESTPLGLLIRGKAPDPFESHSHLGNFIHDVSEMVSDPLMLASAFSAPEGVGVAGFAADAALRKTLMDQYQKGKVKSFGDLADRVGGTLWEGAKGALLAKAGTVAGEIPVGSLIEKSPLLSAGVKGLYQSAVMTTAGSLLDGHLPNVNDFERSAALIVPLNLATGGAFLRTGEAKQALMDDFAESGVAPSEAIDKINAQVPVKPDLEPGLRPALQIGEDVFEGEEGERHTDLAERLGSTPITMERLEADPALADKVLQEPETHEQAVIDKAFELKKAAIDNGEEDELPERGKSGRGFVTPDGKFLDRNQAKRWSKENEPEVHDMWADVVGGDAKAELHAEDYGIARMRVSGRNVASGEPDLSLSPQLEKFLATTRSELNEIKAGNKSDRYGHSVIRDLFVGPRNMFRAATEQVVGQLRKLIPDHVDQEALSFMRDYRDDPASLRSEIEEVRSGKNEKLKALIPSMERALNPSPEMLQADSRLTQHFTQALDTGRQLGILDSTIDPARYSPRLFMKAMEDGQAGKGVGRGKFTEKTPHAIQRTNLRLLAPLKSGDFEARTFNALDELSVYGDRFATSAATKLFTTELKNSEMGKWGSGDTVPEDWAELAPALRGFRQSMTIKDAATGESHSFSRSLMVPKVVADAMKPMLGEGGLPSQVLKALHFQNFVKLIELSLSPFHMKALTVTALNNMSLGDFTRALKSDNDSAVFHSAETEGALWGLETTKTGTPYEAYRGLETFKLERGIPEQTEQRSRLEAG